MGCMDYSKNRNETDEKNNDKIVFFQKLLETVIEYEKKRKVHINNIYISIDSLNNPWIFKISELPIKRQTLLNATLFAVYNGDMDIVKKMTSFFLENEMSTNELGGLVDYVLEHSMDMNEFIVGEKERIIYKEKESKLEKGYIFSIGKQQGYKKLKIK